MAKPRAILVSTALLLAAATAPATATTYPLVLADGLGGTITIGQCPRRIVSLAPNVTEILFAIGAGDRVVGVTRYCNYPPKAARRRKIGGYTDISVESVLALAPDLAIANRGTPRSSLAVLSRHGVAVLAIEPQSVESVERAIVLIGRATDNDRQARAVCEQIERVVASVRRTVGHLKQRRRVYFGSLTAPYFSVGPTSFIGRNIALAGGDNIARDARDPWPILSIETIIDRNPEVLITGLQAKRKKDEQREVLLARLRANRVWSQISAVRTGRVYVLDDDLLQRPGPRLGEAVAAIARCLYPERFAEHGGKKLK